MTRFRHDLILRMIKLLDAVLVTIPFAMCWYLYYAKRVASPYYAKGDYLVVALFFVLFIIFGRVYDAFLMSMQRISEIIYEQFLAAAVSDFIMYIVIWLLSSTCPTFFLALQLLWGRLLWPQFGLITLTTPTLKHSRRRPQLLFMMPDVVWSS